MAEHTDTEHLSELTSSSNEQERLPDTFRPVQSWWGPDDDVSDLEATRSQDLEW